MAQIGIVSTETSEQPYVVEANKVTAIPDPSIASKVPVSEPSSSVMVVQPLINLKEEPVVTNADEEPEVAVNPFVI